MKNKLALFAGSAFIVLLLCHSAAAFEGEEKIVSAYLSAFHPQAASAAARVSSASRPDGTLALLSVVRAWHDLSPDAKTTLAPYFSEVTVAGRTTEREAAATSGSCESYLGTSAESRQSAHFTVYYTTSSSSQDKVDSSGSSGTPYYISDLLSFAEYIWNHEVDTLGFTAPPLHSGKYPIYICDLVGRKNMLGLTVTDAYYLNYSARSYIELDNDYANVILANGVTLQGMIQVTLAHEFFHAIQFGLNWKYPSYWMLESNATWMEDEVYPDVNDYVVEYLDVRFNNPDKPLDHFSYSDVIAYGSAIFWKYVSEKIGGSSAMYDVWQLVKDDRQECYHNPCTGVGDDEITEISQLQQYLTSKGYAFNDVFTSYSAANYLKQYIDGTLSFFPPVTPTLTTTGTSSTLDHLSTKYYRAAASGTGALRLTVTFNGASTSTWSVRLLLTRTDGAIEQTDIALANGAGAAGIDGWNSTYTGAVIIVNNLGTTISYDDKSFSFSLSTSASCAVAQTSPALASGWSLVTFPFIARYSNPTDSGIAAGDIWYYSPADQLTYTAGQSGFAGLGSPGTGYWLNRALAGAVSIDGCATTATNADVPLKAGWNIFGGPFDEATPWADSNVAVLTDGDPTEYTLSQAIEKGWLTPSIYDWTGAAYTARNHNSGFSLARWTGYWIVAKRNLFLRFSR